MHCVSNGNDAIKARSPKIKARPRSIHLNFEEKEVLF